MCSTPDQLLRALEALDGDVVVEARIRGRELACGVLETASGRAEALPITELIPGEGHDFFDFDAKYTPGRTREVTPAEVDDAVRDRVQAAAVRAHRVLGCRHLSRTDFMVSDGDVFLLETNTVPGMTSTSLVPQAAAAHGLPFSGLVHRLIELAETSPT